MRTCLTAAVLFAVTAAAQAQAPAQDGPVTGGLFGMGGSDYYGEIRNRVPYTRELAERPIGIADIERVKMSRRAGETAQAKRRHRKVGAAR